VAPDPVDFVIAITSPPPLRSMTMSPAASRDRPLRRIGVSVLLAAGVHVAVVVIAWQVAELFFLEEIATFAKKTKPPAPSVPRVAVSTGTAIEITSVTGFHAQGDVDHDFLHAASAWASPTWTPLARPQPTWRPAFATAMPAAPARR
jgi:hypothetical protein